MHSGRCAAAARGFDHRAGVDLMVVLDGPLAGA